MLRSFDQKKLIFLSRDSATWGCPEGASKPRFLSCRPYWLSWIWLGGFGFGGGILVLGF